MLLNGVVDILLIILQMKLIVILICIAIDCVSGEEQRTIGNETFELTEDVNNTRSLISPGISPYSSDEGLRGKYAQDNSFGPIASSTKNVDPVEKSPSRNISPAIEASTVKPSSSKSSIKKKLEIVDSGKPAKYFEILSKIQKPNDTGSVTEKKSLQVKFFIGSLREADAQSRRKAKFKGNARTVLRRKRELVDEEASHPTKYVDDPTNIVDSYKAYVKLRNKLPAALRQQVRKTDQIEDKLFKIYAKDPGNAPQDISDSYYDSLKEERNVLVNIVGYTPLPKEEAWQVVNDYKALRKGYPLWNFIALRPSLKKFLSDESAAGNWQYLSVKKGEYNGMGLSKLQCRGVQDKHDYDSRSLSINDYYSLLEASEPLRAEIDATDGAEKKMLEECKTTGQMKDAVDAYFEARKKEIQKYKDLMNSLGIKKQCLIYVYSKIRKGTAWGWMRSDFNEVFDRNLQCRYEYEAIKKEEAYTDEYLDGSKKVGEISRNVEGSGSYDKALTQKEREERNRKKEREEELAWDALKEKIEKENKQRNREEAAKNPHHEERRKAADEEWERLVRSKESETVEYDVRGENADNAVDASTDAEVGVEVLGTTDNVTSADLTITKTATDTGEYTEVILLGYWRNPSGHRGSPISLKF